MAPRGGSSRHCPARQTRTAKAAEFYHQFVPPDDKATMPALEEVRMVWAYKEDEEVEEQVSGIITDLGCTRTRNSKFYRTLKLYWHTKTMVALGMLPKDQDFRQLKQRMESLEEQNSLLMMMFSWLVQCHWGTFPLPLGGCRHIGSSSAAGPMTSSGLVAPQVPLSDG
jgi:hypothetical protein